MQVNDQAFHPREVTGSLASNLVDCFARTDNPFGWYNYPEIQQKWVDEFKTTRDLTTDFTNNIRTRIGNWNRLAQANKFGGIHAKDSDDSGGCVVQGYHRVCIRQGSERAPTSTKGRRLKLLRIEPTFAREVFKTAFDTDVKTQRQQSDRQATMPSTRTARTQTQAQKPRRRVVTSKRKEPQDASKTSKPSLHQNDEIPMTSRPTKRFKAIDDFSEAMLCPPSISNIPNTPTSSITDIPDLPNDPSQSFKTQPTDAFDILDYAPLLHTTDAASTDDMPTAHLSLAEFDPSLAYFGNLPKFEVGLDEGGLTPFSFSMPSDIPTTRDAASTAAPCPALSAEDLNTLFEADLPWSDILSNAPMASSEDVTFQESSVTTDLFGLTGQANIDWGAAFSLNSLDGVQSDNPLANDLPPTDRNSFVTHPQQLTQEDLDLLFADLDASAAQTINTDVAFLESLFN